MAKRTDNTRWTQFLIDLSENLLYDDIMLDRWVRSIKKAGGKVGLEKLISYLKEISQHRQDLASAKGEEQIRQIEGDIDQTIDVFFDAVIDFYSDSTSNETIKSVILTLAFESATKNQISAGKSSDAALRSDIRSALVDQFAGFGPNRLSKAALRYAYSIGLPSKKIGMIASFAFEGEYSNMFFELLGSAKELEGNEMTPEEKKQDADDYIVATQPSGAQDELSYDEWLSDASKSLGVSTDYIERVLKKNKKQGNEVPAPAQPHERELSAGAKFGLNYLTLFNPKLEDRDENWFLQQYAFLTQPQLKSGKDGQNFIKFHEI